MADKRDLLILGGGLVGMTLALAAARKGISSHVVDRADPAELTAEGFDGRASAISTASWNLFTNIGLADRLAPHGCPIASIAVTDGMKPGRIDFRTGPYENPLGLMFTNRELRLALFEAAKEQPLVAWHPRADVTKRERGEFGVAATLADGTRLEGALMVAAEGRRSPTRDEAGIALANWDYKHRAIIIGLTHSKSHDNVAWEIFYPEGPFALLPSEVKAQRVRSRWEYHRLLFLRTLLAAAGLTLVGYVLYAASFVGTLPEMTAIFFWAFGTDLSIEALTRSAAGLKKS